MKIITKKPLKITKNPYHQSECINVISLEKESSLIIRRHLNPYKNRHIIHEKILQARVPLYTVKN